MNHKHLTVESSANFGYWSIRHTSKGQAFTINERDSNKKSLKENVEKQPKILTCFRSSEWTKWSKGVLVLCATQGPLEKTIHYDLVAVLQENVVLCSNVTRFCRETISSLNSKEVSSSPKNDGFDQVNEAMLLDLSDEPFSSRQPMARIIRVPKSSVYRPFADSLHFTVKQLHCVPRHPMNHLSEMFPYAIAKCFDLLTYPGVEIIPPNLQVTANYLCEFAIPHMKAKVKTHRPKQGLKRITFQVRHGSWWAGCLRI
jgi:hypothetical protein